jgi:ABC-2 type transport system ATP-binding protein
MDCITVENLCKKYRVPKKVEGRINRLANFFYPSYEMVNALQNVSFSIPEGEMLAYLGPNGAGKSTTVKVLTGVLTPTSGKALVNGIIPYENRYESAYNYGVVFGQRSLLWFHLPVQQSFRLYSSIYELDEKEYEERLQFFQELFEIGHLLHVPVRKLSLGQRIRCEIVAALLHCPKILFLDEPTIGLDVVMKNKIRTYLKEINEKENTTVFLSSHDMLDVEGICQKAIILDKGQIVYQGTIQRLKKAYSREVTINFEYQSIVDQAELNDALSKGEVLSHDAGSYSVRVDTTNTVVGDVVHSIFNTCRVLDIRVEERTLESIINEIYTGGFSE